MTPTEWPKPSSTPTNTLVLLGLTLLVGWAAYAGVLSYGWLVPLGVLLILFAQGERAIYRREKRNYDGWRADMDAMMAECQQGPRWGRGVEFLKEGRRAHSARRHSGRRGKSDRRHGSAQSPWDMAATEPMTA
jgi:hypothetical protein